MASLFTALGTAGSSLDVIEQAIGVIQNNVTNASTPGYVTQTLQLASRPFDLSEGSLGGVDATGPVFCLKTMPIVVAKSVIRHLRTRIVPPTNNYAQIPGNPAPASQQYH